MIKNFLIFSLPFYAIIYFEPPVYVEQMLACEDSKDYVSTGSIFGQGDSLL